MEALEKPLIPPDKPTVRSTPYDTRLWLWKAITGDLIVLEAVLPSGVRDRDRDRDRGISLLADLLELSEADCLAALGDIQARLRRQLQ